MNVREEVANRYWEICRAVVDRPVTVESAAGCLKFLRDHENSEWTALKNACKATLTNHYQLSNVAVTSFSDGMAS